MGSDAWFEFYNGVPYALVLLITRGVHLEVLFVCSVIVSCSHCNRRIMIINACIHRTTPLKVLNAPRYL